MLRKMQNKEKRKNIVKSQGLEENEETVLWIITGKNKPQSIELSIVKGLLNEKQKTKISLYL